MINSHSRFLTSCLLCAEHFGIKRVGFMQIWVSRRWRDWGFQIVVYVRKTSSATMRLHRCHCNGVSQSYSMYCRLDCHRKNYTFLEIAYHSSLRLDYDDRSTRNKNSLWLFSAIIAIFSGPNFTEAGFVVEFITSLTSTGSAAGMWYPVSLTFL